MLTRRQMLVLLASMPALKLVGRSHAGQVTEARSPAVLTDSARKGAPPAIVKPMNAARCLNPVWYWNGPTARYQRFQNLVVWRSDAVDVDYRVQNISRGGGGRIVPFSGERYTVTLDGKPVATFSNEQDRATVTIDTRKLENGWHVLDVETPTGETSVPFPVFVLRGGQLPEQPWMPVLTLSYQANRRDFCHLMWVPAVYAPQHVPVAARRKYPHFSHAARSSDLWFERLLPTSGYNRRTNRNRDGILNTFNTMWYNWGGVMRQFPQNPCLDGPRGVGTIGSIMHIEIGIARESVGPDSPLMHNLYVLDPWRVCRVSQAGEVTTLAGWRHKTPPSYYEDEPELELVGDWSAIPEERHGFWELWGMAWDEETLEVDTAADPIPEERNRQPHKVGPVMFVADSQHNRICRIEFSPVSHTPPAKVTEFITDLKDPWDVVYWNGSIIVSERLSHRISQYDVKTGAFERVIVEGEALATVDRNRRVQRQADLSEIRSEDCVAPEGLYIMDDWLYFGSIAMRQVKRMHLETGELELVVNNAGTGNHYIKLAVSDGTFGPRHTVFFTDWRVRRRGFPYAYLPNGNSWNLPGNPRNSIPRGRGGAIDSLGYSGAVAVRNGRLVCGSVQEGLVDVSLAQSGDPSFNATRFNEGRERWGRDGLNLLYGTGGYGYYGLPLPWGLSEETDYYLEVFGHVRP